VRLRGHPAPALGWGQGSESSAIGVRLGALGPSKRLEEFEAGNLSRAELFAWAARYPEEVPLVNGELPWIVMRLADLD
jgi:hypothetical protein